MDDAAMAPDASPYMSDSEVAIERASDCLALLTATIRGVLNTGDGLSFAEARGALTLLSSVQTDLGSVWTTLQHMAAHTTSPGDPTPGEV